jgi:hypothetical protein
VRCSELSLELGEELAGTAPHVERWHLVEHPGPWGRKAVEHAGVIAPVGSKALFVRRMIPNGRAFLVCTNGARDPCCALKGASVARELGGRATECTHLGGHRFAANVLVLPENLMFGRLDPDAAVTLAAELQTGRLPLEHLRGRCALEPEQQAAEILLRRELGLRALEDAAHVEGMKFALADGRRATVRVRGEQLPPRRVSCRDDKEESPRRWSLERLDLS